MNALRCQIGSQKAALEQKETECHALALEKDKVRGVVLGGAKGRAISLNGGSV